MNVDEAMKVAKREVLGWFDDTHAAAPILAAEVERLRVELAAAGDGDTWREACWRVEKELEKTRAELAAAKAASVCPVKVLNIFEGTYESDRYIELRTDDEADKFTDWLRERMKGVRCERG